MLHGRANAVPVSANIAYHSGSEQKNPTFFLHIDRYIIFLHYICKSDIYNVENNMAAKTTTQDDKNKNTSIAIDAQTSNRLKEFCDKNNITKKDFIVLALDYFDRTKVNIRSNDVLDLKAEIQSMKEAYAQEIEHLSKKMDNVQTAIGTTALTGVAQLIQQQQQSINAQLKEQQETTIQLIEHNQSETQKAIEELKPKKKWWQIGK